MLFGLTFKRRHWLVPAICAGLALAWGARWLARAVEYNSLQSSFEAEVDVLAAELDDVLESEYASLVAFARVLEHGSASSVTDFETLASHFVFAAELRLTLSLVKLVPTGAPQLLAHVGEGLTGELDSLPQLAENEVLRPFLGLVGHSTVLAALVPLEGGLALLASSDQSTLLSAHARRRMDWSSLVKLDLVPRHVGLSHGGSGDLCVSLNALPIELLASADDALFQSRRGPWGQLAFLNVLLGWGLMLSVAMLLYGRAQALARQARSDPLTSLANRLFLNAALEREWARASRNGCSMAVVAIDLDGFKSLNDSRGHSVGDHCLMDVASELRKVCRRPADFAARLGGDEFVLFLPETDERGAVLVAELARLAIRALGLSTGPGGGIMTASLGVAAAVPRHQDESASELFHKADVALYSAKRAGRDRIALASDDDLELIPQPSRRAPSIDLVDDPSCAHSTS